MIGFKTIKKRFSLFHLEERELYSNDVSVSCNLNETENEEDREM